MRVSLRIEWPCFFSDGTHKAGHHWPEGRNSREVDSVPEPYHHGPEVEHPAKDMFRNIVAGPFPPGRWHWEGYRGLVQLW